MSVRSLVIAATAIVLVLIGWFARYELDDASVGVNEERAAETSSVADARPRRSRSSEDATIMTDAPIDVSDERPTLTARVIVVDGSGEGLAAIPIRLTSRDEGVAKRNGRTDADGIFVVHLPIGDYRLTVPSSDYSRDGSFPLDFVTEDVTVAKDDADLRLTVEPVRSRHLTVDANITIDGRPADGRVHVALVRWDGTPIPLEAAGDGVYRGQAEIAAGVRRPKSAPTVEITGAGFADRHLTPATENIDGTRLSFTHDIKSFSETADVVYVDGAGRPLSNEALHLMVMHGSGCSTFAPIDIRTDARGAATIFDVERPFRFFVATQPAGFRVTPRDVVPAIVRTKDVQTIVRESRHAVRLTFNDPGFARAVVDARSHGVMLDVRCLDGTREVVRNVWSDPQKMITDTALTALREHGIVELGDLPQGRYLATLFVPSRGTWRMAFDVDEALAQTEVAVRLEDGKSLAKATVRHDGRPLRDAVVFDGYVDLTLVPTLVGNVMFNAVDIVPAAERAFARTDSDGHCRLMRHNALATHVTVVTYSGEVFHVAKSDFSGDVALAHDPSDGSLVGTVVDASGHPVPNISVNLGGLRGGEGHGAPIWPRGAELRQVPTDRDGRFAIHGVTPGAYVLSAALVDTSLEDGILARRFQIAPSSIRMVKVESRPQEITLRVTETAMSRGCACEHDEGHGGDHDHEDGR